MMRGVSLLLALTIMAAASIPAAAQQPASKVDIEIADVHFRLMGPDSDMRAETEPLTTAISNSSGVGKVTAILTLCQARW
jgi:hypothetical protein